MIFNCFFDYNNINKVKLLYIFMKKSNKSSKFEKFDRAEKEIKEAEDAVLELEDEVDGEDRELLTKAVRDLEKAEAEVEEADENGF